MGPMMESAPKQKIMIAVESPWERFDSDLERLSTKRSKRPLMSSAVPMTPPMARLAIDALPHALDDGIDANAHGSKTHGEEKHVLVLLAEAALGYGPNRASQDNGRSVRDGSDHSDSLSRWSALWRNARS